MRDKPHPPILLVALLVVGLLALAAALRLGWIRLGVDATASPWLVGTVAITAAALVLGLVRGLRLVDRTRALFPSPSPAGQIVTELSTLAGTALNHGLLTLAADETARRYPLVTSGLHLLCEDADRRLIRASLESQAESQLFRTGSSRSSIILVSHMIQLCSALALASALLIMALNAQAPWALGREFALFVLGSFAAFASTSALVGPIIALLRRRAAADEFVAAAAVEAVLAIQARDDAAATRARLEAMLPAPPAPKLPDRARLAA